MFAPPLLYGRPCDARLVMNTQRYTLYMPPLPTVTSYPFVTLPSCLLLLPYVVAHLRWLFYRCCSRLRGPVGLEHALIPRCRSPRSPVGWLFLRFICCVVVTFTLYRYTLPRVTPVPLFTVWIPTFTHIYFVVCWRFPVTALRYPPVYTHGYRTPSRFTLPQDWVGYFPITPTTTTYLLTLFTHLWLPRYLTLPSCPYTGYYVRYLPGRV